MDFQAFAAALNYLASFSGMAVATGVWAFPIRSRRHNIFATVLGLSSLLIWWWALHLESRDIYTTSPYDFETATVLGAGILLFSIHAMVHRHFSRRRLSLRLLFRSWARLAIMSIFISGMLFVGGVAILTPSQFILAVGVIFACTIFSSVVFKLLANAQDHGVDRELLQFLPARATTAAAYLRDMSRSRYFEKIKIVSRLEIESLEATALDGILKTDTVLNREAIRKHLKKSTQLESWYAARDILLAKDAWALTVIPGSGDLLVATPLALTSVKKFELQMLVVARLVTSLESARRLAQEAGSLVPRFVASPQALRRDEPELQH